MNERLEYITDHYHVRWWSKDGAWHVALPFEPTDEDRRQYPTTYGPGTSAPYLRWTEHAFNTAEEAVAWATHPQATEDQR